MLIITSETSELKLVAQGDSFKLQVMAVSGSLFVC